MKNSQTYQQYPLSKITGNQPDRSIDAYVTVRFRLNNLTNESDLVDSGMNLEQMVRYLIKEEGLFGITSSKGRILKVEAA